MATTKNTKISYRSNDPIVNEPLIIESGNNNIYIDSNLKAFLKNVDIDGTLDISGISTFGNEVKIKNNLIIQKEESNDLKNVMSLNNNGSIILYKADDSNGTTINSSEISTDNISTGSLVINSQNFNNYLSNLKRDIFTTFITPNELISNNKVSYLSKLTYNSADGTPTITYKNFDTSLNNTSLNAPTTKAVKDAIDSEANTRNNEDTSIRNSITDILNGSSSFSNLNIGSLIKLVKNGNDLLIKGGNFGSSGRNLYDEIWSINNSNSLQSQINNAKSQNKVEASSDSYNGIVFDGYTKITTNSGSVSFSALGLGIDYTNKHFIIKCGGDYIEVEYRTDISFSSANGKDWVTFNDKFSGTPVVFVQRIQTTGTSAYEVRTAVSGTNENGFYLHHSVPSGGDGSSSNTRYSYFAINIH